MVIMDVSKSKGGVPKNLLTGDCNKYLWRLFAALSDKCCNTNKSIDQHWFIVNGCIWKFIKICSNYRKITCSLNSFWKNEIQQMALKLLWDAKFKPSSCLGFMDVMSLVSKQFWIFMVLSTFVISFCWVLTVGRL